MSEREQFEQWATENRIGRLWRDTEPGYEDQYADSHAQMAWRAWQGRAQLAAPADLVRRLLADHQRVEPHHADQCPLCREATAAIGVVPLTAAERAELGWDDSLLKPAQGERQPDDASRLDWLEKSTQSFCGNYDGSGFRMLGSSIWHGTLREAIDAAMK